MLLYTANIGGYDQVQVTPQPGFDLLVYQNKFNYVQQSDVKTARFHKIIPPIMDFDINIWLDSNISINCDLKSFVNKWLTKDIDMVLMEHGRDCIYEEMDACIKRKKDTKQNIERQREFYKTQGYPKHQGMVGTGIMIRRVCNNVDILMDIWLDVLNNYSHRDQLSFNYALWECQKDPKFKIKIAYIPYSVFGNEFELVPHGK